MVTVEEHTTWLRQYTGHIAIMFSDNGWNATCMLNGEFLQSGPMVEIAEATRELCDEVFLKIKEVK